MDKLTYMAALSELFVFFRSEPLKRITFAACYVNSSLLDCTPFSKMCGALESQQKIGKLSPDSFGKKKGGKSHRSVPSLSPRRLNSQEGTHYANASFKGPKSVTDNRGIG